MNSTWNKIINNLTQIQGISTKQAHKLTLLLLQNKYDEIENLKKTLFSIEKLNICEECKMIYETKCLNCEKKSNYLYVLNKIQDYISLYNLIDPDNQIFILDITSKSDLAKLESINLIMDRLMNYVNKYNFQEIFLMMPPSVETELISRVFQEYLNKNNKSNIVLSKISTGIPFGSTIEYSSDKTIKEVIKNREKI